MGYPDGEDGVFLTDGLSAADAVVVAGANFFADDVEYDADYEARYCHQDVDVVVLGIVDDGVHHICHQYHDGTRPKVKRRRIVLDEQAVELGNEMFYQFRCHHRQYEERKHFFQDCPNALQKRKPFLRMYQWEKQWNDDGDSNVADDGVSDYVGAVAAQLVDYYNGGSGSGAESYYEDALGEYLVELPYSPIRKHRRRHHKSQQ